MDEQLATRIKKNARSRRIALSRRSGYLAFGQRNHNVWRRRSNIARLFRPLEVSEI